MEMKYIAFIFLAIVGCAEVEYDLDFELKPAQCCIELSVGDQTIESCKRCYIDQRGRVVEMEE